MNSQQPEFINPPFGNPKTLRYLENAIPAYMAGTNAKRSLENSDTVHNDGNTIPPTEKEEKGSEKKHTTQKGSLYDSNDRKDAIELILKGEGVALFNVGVGALLGGIPLLKEQDNGEERVVPKFARVVNETKGEKRIGKPLSGALPTSEFIKYIDFQKIKPEMRAFFSKPKNIIDQLGSLCFIRAPITEDAVRKLPPEMVERDPKTNIPYFQNWDPHGNPPLEHICKSLIDAGIVPAITSLNTSGTKEIVTTQESLSFSDEKNLPLFLSNEPPSGNNSISRSNPILSNKNSGTQKGSFTILGLGEEGITLLRDGTLPIEVLNFLLKGVEGFVNFTEENIPKTKTRSYDQHKIPSKILEGLSPSEGRIAILAYFYGKDPDELKKTMNLIHHRALERAA